MSIQQEYQRQLTLHHYQDDPAQSLVVDELEQLQRDLKLYLQHSQKPLHKIRQWLGATPPHPGGCYIWGDVGRGKTWLMDMFYDTLDETSLVGQQKLRLHFHHFMQAIHDQLSLIGERKHPLRHIAKSFASRYKVICLDEFHVSDITDAMLLYGLLENLFAENIILLATSNQPPDNLYKNGLQRERFLPAIQLIKQHTQTLQLDGPVDHRLRLLEQAECWYNMGDDSHQDMEKRFIELSNSAAQRNSRIHIHTREIKTILLSYDIIWFDFDVICGNQRGSADYIEIAQQYHTVFISNIPQLDDGLNDKARRFINMIDEFYDRSVKILASAKTKPENLYQGDQLAFEFKRTISRLEEMRSHDYLQRPHKNP